MFPEKLNLKCWDRVRIKNTGTVLDGDEVIVVGLVSRNIVDVYILEFPEDRVQELPGFGYYTSFPMPEFNLEKI